MSIAIFDDRLEISSSGSLPFDLTTDDLVKPHASRPLNPLIAQVFYRRGIIETWGRGTIKIRELTSSVGLIPPDFYCQMGEVVVKFYSSQLESQVDLQLESQPQLESQVDLQLESQPQLESQVDSQLESRPQPESQDESQLESTDLSLQKIVLELLENGPLSKSEISLGLGQKQVSGQLHKLVRSLLSNGFIEMTIPDKPQSRLQRYVLKTTDIDAYNRNS